MVVMKGDVADAMVSVISSVGPGGGHSHLPQDAQRWEALFFTVYSDNGAGHNLSALLSSDQTRVHPNVRFMGFLAKPASGFGSFSVASCTPPTPSGAIMEAGRQLWRLLQLPDGYARLPRYQDMLGRGFLPRVNPRGAERTSAVSAAVPRSPSVLASAASALASLGGVEPSGVAPPAAGVGPQLTLREEVSGLQQQVTALRAQMQREAGAREAAAATMAALAQRVEYLIGRLDGAGAARCVS